MVHSKRYSASEWIVCDFVSFGAREAEPLMDEFKYFRMRTSFSER